MTQEKESMDSNEKPPIFGSWRMIYIFVLGIYVALLMLFTWLTFSYQ